MNVSLVAVDFCVSRCISPCVFPLRVAGGAPFGRQRLGLPGDPRAAELHRERAAEGSPRGRTPRGDVQTKSAPKALFSGRRAPHGLHELGGARAWRCLAFCPQAMRAGISEFGRVLEEEEEECLAPALQCQKDLETWQWRWPSLCFPVRATGGRRLAIGLEVWAAALPDAAQLLEPLEVVDAAAEEARLQALQELNLEEIDQDELPEPEPHEPRGFKLLLKLLESCCLELFGAFYRCLSSPRGLKEAFRVMF